MQILVKVMMPQVNATQLSHTQSDENIVAELNMNATHFEYMLNDEVETTVYDSKYFTEKQFSEHLENCPVNETSFLHFNVRSMNANFDRLSLFLDNFQDKYPIIGITETWFSSHSTAMYDLPRYQLITNDRQSRSGGGVAMYIPISFECQTKTELYMMNDSLESLFVEIIIPGEKNLLVGVVYRPPNGDVNEFIEELSNTLSSPLSRNKKIIIMGDFNINLLSYDHDNSVNNFVDTLSTFSLIPLINKPTRVADNSQTLIDNIFTNLHPIPTAGVIVADISDHFPIFARTSLALRSSCTESYDKLTRKFTQGNIAKFKRELETVEWNEVLCETEVDKSFDKFMDIMVLSYDRCFPLVQRSKQEYKRVPRMPWVTKSLLRSINKKNRLFCRYKAKQTGVAKLKYTNYRNILTSALRQAKKDYYQFQFQSTCNNVKGTWKVIRNVLKTNPKLQSITKLTWKDGLIEDKKLMCEAFNEYFSNIGATLSSSIPDIQETYGNYLTSPNEKSLFFVPVVNSEVIDVVSGLKRKKSPGYDGITNDLIKEVISFVVVPLTHIYNLSLMHGIVPKKNENS